MPRVGLWSMTSLDAKGWSVVHDFSWCQGSVYGLWILLMQRVGLWFVNYLDAKGGSVVGDFGIFFYNHLMFR